MNFRDHIDWIILENGEGGLGKMADTGRPEITHGRGCYWPSWGTKIGVPDLFVLTARPAALPMVLRRLQGPGPDDQTVTMG
jgi:hypothetical protein